MTTGVVIWRRRASRLPFPVLRRLAFWGYAAVLMVATHWPRLEIKVGEIERPDLVLHLGAFGLWTFLLACTGYLGHPERVGSAARALAIGLVFAAVNEGSQSLPFVQRQAAFDDFLANGAGVVMGAAGALVFARLVVRWFGVREAPGAGQELKP